MKKMTNKTVKFWNMASVSEDEGEIILYGDVVDAQPIDWWTGQPEPGNFITPEGFMEDLQTVKNKSKITVKLNSCGGDLYTGIAIHNAIKALTAEVTVIVEGIAASAASVVMCAGKKVKCHPGSIVMIHGASTRACGSMNQQDFEKYARALGASNKAMAAIYAVKTGKSEEELLELMADELWMSGEQAVEYGFADELIETGESASITCSADRKTLFVNGITHDVGSFKIPEFIKVYNQAQPVGINNNNNGGQKMTLERLKKEHPDLVAQIQEEVRASVQADIDAAVERERNRIKEIDEASGNVVDKAMVEEAKYGETRCTGDELIIRAFKASAITGQQKGSQGTDGNQGFLASYKADGAESNVNDVTANPSAGLPKTKEEEMKDEVMTVVEAYKSSKGV